MVFLQFFTQNYMNFFEITAFFDTNTVKISLQLPEPDCHQSVKPGISWELIDKRQPRGQLHLLLAKAGIFNYNSRRFIIESWNE